MFRFWIIPSIVSAFLFALAVLLRKRWLMLPIVALAVSILFPTVILFGMEGAGTVPAGALPSIQGMAGIWTIGMIYVIVLPVAALLIWLANKILKSMNSNIRVDHISGSQ